MEEGAIFVAWDPVEIFVAWDPVGHLSRMSRF